jgi:hypothetical protein
MRLRLRLPTVGVESVLDTEELGQTRAWFSIQTMLRPPPHSFLMR